MKSFVRKIEESDRWLAVVLGVGAVALVLASEATNELTYLPVFALLVIQYVRRWRQDRQKGA